MKRFLFPFVAVALVALLADSASACDQCDRLFGSRFISARSRSVSRATSITINRPQRQPRALRVRALGVPVCAVPMAAVFAQPQYFVAPQAQVLEAPCHCPQVQTQEFHSLDVAPAPSGGGSAAAAAGGGGASAAASQ